MSTTRADVHYDVVVVGARIAGSATAMLLGRLGHRVLVVDRALAGGDTVSTHGLMRAGVLQLHRWGLLENVKAASTPALRHSRFVYDDGEDDVPVRAAGGVDALYAPRRTVLDPVLVRAARTAGAEVRQGVGADRLITEAGGRVAGVVLSTGERVGARIVVGADGRGSLVARAVGAPVTWQGRAASAFIYAYWAGLDGDGYEWQWSRGAMAGVVPTNGGASCVVIGMPAAQFREAVNDGVGPAFWRTVQRDRALASRLAEGEQLERFRSFPGAPSRLRRAWGRGWVLVGDAGHWADPLSLHGMTAALRDAELASRAIDDVLSGAPEAAELSRYEEHRDELSIPLLDVVESLASYDWDGSTIRELLRAHVRAMRPEVEMLTALDAPVAVG